MDPTLRTAASGMSAQQTRVEIIANNLSNVNTTGFKRSRAHFEDLLYQSLESARRVDGAEAETTEGVQVGRGTRLNSIQRIHSQGALEQSGRPLDFAIEGRGFFQVELPDGSRAYTRDGSFNLSDRGTLVTQQGYAVVPGIDIPPDAGEVAVARNGVVSVLTPGATEPVEVGRIELARFNNPSGLRSLGENLFAETGGSGAPVPGFPQESGFGRILQGSLESSNVEIVREMVEMISAQRAYEISSKAVQTSDEMAQSASQLIR